MSFIPKDVQDDLNIQIEKKSDKKKNIFGIEKNKDDYANMSNDKIDADVNQLRINVDDSIDKPAIKINEIVDEEQYLEDIDDYFSIDEQFELVSEGIKITTSKQYKIQTNKTPLWRGNITKVFLKWLKNNHPDELKFLKKTDQTKKKEKVFLSAKDLSKKMEDYSKKREREIIDEIYNDNEQNELLDKGIQFKDVIIYYKNTEKKVIINGKITEEYKMWLKENYPESLSYITETEEIKDIIKEVITIESKQKTASGVFNISKPKTKPQSIVEPKFTITETEDIKETGSEIIVQDQEKASPLQQIEIKRYPTEAEILFLIKRHKFVKENLLDKNDSIFIKKKGFIKKSGWRKFINAFGISIELIDQKVYEKFNDKHAEVRVRAIAPNGQSVEGIGIKSWSELYDKNMHNLVANAWTRAVNRAVSDLVGYGAVSADELPKNEYESDVF